MRIYTVGHSTHPLDEFVALLRGHQVEAVVDVRTIAKSRHNPQYGQDQLATGLAGHGIAYRRMESLGGLRHSRKDSINGAWRNTSFRGYADYMQTREFADGIRELISFAGQQPSAIMCAEAVPWRCHRSLIGDALLVRGVEVLDIMSEKSAKPHTLTGFAKVDGKSITYPPESPEEDPTTDPD